MKTAITLLSLSLLVLSPGAGADAPRTENLNGWTIVSRGLPNKNGSPVLVRVCKPGEKEVSINCRYVDVGFPWGKGNEAQAFEDYYESHTGGSKRLKVFGDLVVNFKDGWRGKVKAEGIILGPSDGKSGQTALQIGQAGAPQVAKAKAQARKSASGEMRNGIKGRLLNAGAAFEVGFSRSGKSIEGNFRGSGGNSHWDTDEFPAARIDVR